MKKSIVLGSIFFVGIVGIHAQQLKNSDFSSWVDCKPLESYETPGSKVVGQQPDGWFASNVNQSGKTAVLVEQKQEDNGNYYVEMHNEFVGISASLGSNAPGYITLGTPWAYAFVKVFSNKIENADGGTYGGINFTNRPDAIKFKYKSPNKNTDEVYTVSAYSWKGFFESSEKVGVGMDLMGGDLKSITMKDRDKIVLANNQETGKLISSITETFNGTEDGLWHDKTIYLSYNSDENPEKFNIIFSSANYYGERKDIIAGATLCIDDVQLIYNSELASLTYDSKPITVQENMDLSDQMYDENKLSCTLTGKGATVDKSFNKVTGVLTLTVKGNDWTEENPSNQNVYTIQFAKPIPSSAEVAGDYDPLLNISVYGKVVPSVNDISISEQDGSTVFTMKNFNFAGSLDMGDIEVPGATLSYVDNGIKISVVEQEVMLKIGLATISIDAVVDNNKELTGTVSIDYSGLPVSVSMVKCPFERVLTNYTLTVKGDVTSDVAAAVVPLGKTVGLVDLTQATLGDGLNTSNFLYNPEATNNILYKISDTQSLEGNNVIKNGVCENFVLTDGQSFNAPKNFTASQITYNRVIALSTDKDEVYTFVLPFTFTADKVNGTVYELSGVNNGVLDFTSLEGSMELKANRPYLVVSNGTQLLNASAFSGEVVATGDLTNEVIGGVTMVGAYEATPITSDASWYGYNAKGEFVKATTGTINPFRTAIKSTGSQSSFALKLDGTVTGIVNLENPNAKVDVYTISGVCVRKNVPAATALNGLSRGVYIVGGQKVVK